MSFTVELPSQVEGCRLPGLRRELFHRLQQQSDLILDCSNVTQLSRGGQALLVATLRAARRRGVRLSFLDPSDALVTALRSTGLRHLLTGAPGPGAGSLLSGPLLIPRRVMVCRPAW